MADKIQELKQEIEQLKKEISNIEKEIQCFDVAEYVSEEMYDEMLDDCYGEINICGISYMASDAFKSIDPIAYRCGFNEYTDTIDPETIKEYNDLIEKKEDMEYELADLQDELEFELEFIEDEL